MILSISFGSIFFNPFTDLFTTAVSAQLWKQVGFGVVEFGVWGSLVWGLGQFSLGFGAVEFGVWGSLVWGLGQLI